MRTRQREERAQVVKELVFAPRRKDSRKTLDTGFCKATHEGGNKLYLFCKTVLEVLSKRVCFGSALLGGSKCVIGKGKLTGGNVSSFRETAHKMECIPCGQGSQTIRILGKTQGKSPLKELHKDFVGWASVCHAPHL